MKRKKTRIIHIVYWFSCLLNVGIGIRSWLFPFFSETPTYIEELTDKGYGVLALLELYASFIHLNRFVIYLCLLMQIVSIVTLKKAGTDIKAKRNTTLISSVLLAVPVVVYWVVVLYLFHQIEWI